MRSLPRVRAALLLALTGVVAGALAGCGGSAISPVAAAKANRLALPQTTSQPVVPSGTTGPVAPGQVPTGPSAPGVSGPTGGPGAPSGAPTTQAPAAPPGAASCAGFKNSTGISNSVIRVGNASDISGPVPALFTAAQQASRAYIQYFNSTGGSI